MILRGPAAGWVRVGSLLLLKAGAGALAVHDGFSHVSDDDYARVVIAERFAHAPALDPSGTSWLPLPFWVDGAAMLAAGRSLATASFVAWTLGLASVVIGYLALRAASVSPSAAWIAAALAATSPWSVWLGVATVPEAFTGALIFAGALTVAAPAWRPAGGAALLVASLSRYEAWPVAAVFVAWTALERPTPAARGGRGAALALAGAGPCLWLAWNAHAHGDPLHFLARVSTFHAAHTALPLTSRALAYPSALTHDPALVVALALGIAGGPRILARWRGPLAAAAALVAFLVAGEVVGGAPTHHPARALAGVWWILAGFGVDGARALFLRHAWARPKREAWAVALGVTAAGLTTGDRVARLRDPPGATPEEDRTRQLALGAALRESGTPGFAVVPCAYEHFAVIAAFGAPEAVTTLPPADPATARACPELRLP